MLILKQNPRSFKWKLLHEWLFSIPTVLIAGVISALLNADFSNWSQFEKSINFAKFDWSILLLVGAGATIFVLLELMFFHFKGQKKVLTLTLDNDGLTLSHSDLLSGKKYLPWDQYLGYRKVWKMGFNHSLHIQRPCSTAILGKDFPIKRLAEWSVRETAFVIETLDFSEQQIDQLLQVLDRKAVSASFVRDAPSINR